MQKNLTVLMFHGNAGNIGHRIPIARMFVQRMGCSVFMLEYRGYGLSTGSPDEAGLMIDAQTGYDYIRRRAETRDNDIWTEFRRGSERTASSQESERQEVGWVSTGEYIHKHEEVDTFVRSAPFHSICKLTRIELSPQQNI
jgi:fermentation-respiration switch protein FrsA (DUF1100 family)